MLQKCNGIKISELDSRKSFTGSEYVVVADNEENYKIPIEQISDVVVDSSKFKAVVENVYTSSEPVADVTLDEGTFKFTFGIPPGEKGKDGKDGVDGIDGRDGLPGAPGKDGATGEATRVIIAYKSTRTTTKPDAPVGGGWDYNTNTPIYPTGWSNTDDNPNGYLWQSSATFAERGTMLIPWDGPFRLTGDDGTAGLDGISYALELSNLAFTYTTAQDSEGTVTGYPFNCTGLVRVVKYEGKAKTYLSTSEVVIKTSLTDDSTQTTQSTVSGNAIKIDISGTLSTQNTVLAIFAYDTNGAIYVSTAVPVSASGKNGADGKDGADAPGQTFAGSPLRMRGLWESGTTYYDGKRATSDGAFYQDVVLYNNTYYACINTEDGNTDNWQTPPDGGTNKVDVTWFAQFTLTEDQMINMLIANKAFIKELSTNELVIFDGETVVAGMTSSKAVGEDSSLNGIVNDKGNVRIWAGEMQVSGDLTSAPFTVTDQGVVKSQGKNGTIILKDGTIYFIVNNVEYRLGITDGKPDWINDAAAGSVSVQFYQLNKSGNYVVSTGGSANLRYLSNGKYYTNSTLTTLANGTMYQFMSSSSSPILLNNTYKLVCEIGKIGGEEIYRKVTFADGVMTAVGTVAIAYSMSVATQPTISSAGAITRDTTGKMWCSFEEFTPDSTGSVNFINGNTAGSGSISCELVDSSNIGFGTQATRDLKYYVLKTTSAESVNTDLKYTDYEVDFATDGDATFKLNNQSIA